MVLAAFSEMGKARFVRFLEEPFEYVLDTIRDGAEFTLYRGQQRNDATPVLVVAPAAEEPQPQSLRRLEYEYSLAAELEPAWAAKPIALTRDQGRTILVIADPGGDPLDIILQRHGSQPLDLTRFLRLAIGITSALAHLHRRCLIHRDIKPENVLADDAGNVWLTGFGKASRLPRERQGPALSEMVAGTLAYMSPEQTGRMNRSTDTRSDLYSLGVVLYQMLTGVLPFVAADPLEWVHCHIARQPLAPIERCGAPKLLSAITMRLLAKNAEDRYQTAAGLESDLRRCLVEWQWQGRIEPFPLGADDLSDRLLIPEKLYGREREVDVLTAAFDRVVAGGRPELVLVSGYSGIGKSAVVNELHKSLVPPRGLFASGKFDQYKRDIPYATLAQAFQNLLRPLLTKSDEELGMWQTAIREAIDPNGRLIVDLVPELKHIVGEQPPVPELPPLDAEARFQLIFRRFIGVFARPEHPLALFLDDLQWLDAATLDLLEHLLIRTDLKHLLLVGAYRENEVNPTHPLIHKLHAIREAGGLVQEIVLTPLGREDLSQMLADSLHCEPARSAPLADLIHTKTTGNPFFAIQFISALADENLLTFDYDHGRWSWELDQIHAKGYTDNVVDLMVGKLNRLSVATQDALQQFACLGNIAEFGVLRMLYRDSIDEMHDQLWEAVRTGLVYRSENSYRFLHDRVQEAAYSLIPQEQRPETHLRIGTLLSEKLPAANLEESIFEILNQLNRGSHLITSSAGRERAAELNLIAARRAKVGTAYVSALSYLSTARSLLTEATWERNHELVFSIECLTAECELLTADMASAETRLTMLAQRSRNQHDFAVVTRLRLTLYTALDQSDLCVDVFLEYLERIGTVWSRHPTREEVLREYRRVWTLVGSRQIEELFALPLMTNSGVLDTLDVFTEIVHPAIFYDENLSSLVVCRIVSLSLEHGNCDASCFGYVWFAMFAGPRFNNYKDGYRFGQLGFDLVEKRGLVRYRARTYLSFATLTPWTKHPATARNLISLAFDAASRNGDLTFSAYSWEQLVTNCLMVGDPLAEVQSRAESGVAFAKKARFGLVVEICSTQLGLVRTLRGLTPTFGCFNDEEFDELRTERLLASNPVLSLAEFFYWTRKLQGRFFAGDYAAAVAASRRAQPLVWTASSQVTSADFPFYSALAYAACCDTASANQRQPKFEALTAHLKQLEVWSEHCPTNFENRAALVGAEIARIEGRTLDAEQLYEDAIRSAHANNFVHNEGLANEHAARFYAARGFDAIADTYLRNARDCYGRWGAIGKVRQLESQHPQLRSQATSSSLDAAIDRRVTDFDAETVVKASQALSSEINLPSLIQKLMQLAVEHAGAERGLLILLHDDGLWIEAEARAGRGSVEIMARHERVTSSDLSPSVLQYVLRTRERVLIDDASIRQSESEDEYIQGERPRSILCLPILTQTKAVGALYLENKLTAYAFTAERVAVLNVLASQSAISLENARLYSDLQRSEAFLAQGQKISQTGSFGWSIDSGEIHWSRENYNILEYDPAARATYDLASDRVHPDDKQLVQQALEQAAKEKADFDFEHRLLMPDGRVKHVHMIGRKVQTGNLDFVGAVTDVTAAKAAEEKIRQSESELRQILDCAPQHMYVLGSDAGRTRLYVNLAALDYLGLTPEQWRTCDESKLFHRDDWERAKSEAQGELLSGVPHQTEIRLLGADGKYRWFLLRWNPLRGKDGSLSRWCVAGTDIEELKVAGQRLLEENVSLREEIDKASMFEEIVGTSDPLKKVLSRITKVAPTDSSVLITGETGTGKELVARAIHRRSRRSAYAFVSVNCAAVPRDLIASELFGHEKGAFTGATQRRLGRFELAEKGTIFLDEVGELPAATQITLLRVLQEREFERVGGSGSIRADVRVIAATNRNLESAIASGEFRRDLYYRLNVFPVEVPPLRNRREDIPLLVTYFLNRYARKAGRDFTAVDKSSLKRLQSYAWPGNIRELQNVIESSVIVSEARTFSVDESWLTLQPQDGDPEISSLFVRPPAQEKAIIEAALRECRGRVYGPSGAAAKLGVPRTTLESKIKSLKINKNLFRRTDPSNG